MSTVISCNLLISNDEFPNGIISYNTLDDWNYLLNYNLNLILFSEKIQKKYGDLNGNTFVVDLNKGSNGLGISLAGTKDRTKMSVFVCGMHPNGSASKDGRIKIGDEILEVNFVLIAKQSF